MIRAFRWKARHTILSVLFVTSIVSFLDRMVMSAVIPFIAKDLELTALESGVLMSVFFAGYALSQVPGGMLADRFGVRRVTAVAMLWWSTFAALTGAATNMTVMLIARFLFGLGEGVYPASAFKAVAVWFPARERATANAIKLASTPLGGALAPLFVVAVMSFGTWRTVFYALFVPGVVIALLFWVLVRDDPSKSPHVTPEELAEIEGDEHVAVAKVQPGMGFVAAFREPGILRYFLVLFAFNIGNWGFTGWLPTYLVKVRGFSAVEMGAAASLPFFAATIGCLIGGWVSDRYFSTRRRVPIMATQLAAALFLYLTFTASSTPMLIVCQTLTGFFLSVFSSTFWALPITTMPKSLMGVLTGLINMAGQIAAFLSPIMIGFLVGAADGGFATAFALMIGTILLSCALVLTLPKHRVDEAAI
ncbi:MFS transporter [Sphingomonas crocodyli]|uniref:MFS transporter n=1 Tax=Sphingomonas crocodyli TaxID=1979270 RepID=A0A437M7D7_9SPHN|nr:MFS transporter [Sphingomonas crocodyli]RVT93523.1 MFS transporter [Sphingomonas crocodyli]